MVNVERDLPWLDIEQVKGRPLAIVGGGPSLADYWPDLMAFEGDILALNNAYPYLMERGIVPSYFMLLDARPENADFLRQKSDQVRHFIAAQCDPIIFDALEGYPVTLYVTTLPDTLELTAHIDKPKRRIAGTVGTVGIKALPLAYALGYRDMRLYGYDSSYKGGAHHAFRQALNDGASTIEVFVDGATYVTTPTMAYQASEFCALARGMVAHLDCDITLRCEGLLPAVVEQANREGETPLEVREREKYEAMWRHDIYRDNAPGARHVSLAFAAGMRGSVIDFGCGSGKASKRMAALGLDVTAVDIAANCLNDDVSVRFIQSCLWDLPDISADWGFCTDVMEHIPMDRVQDVVRGIAARVKACYFNIATRDDVGGSLIGRKLHMTVMGGPDWVRLLSMHFADVRVTNETEGEITLVARHAN